MLLIFILFCLCRLVGVFGSDTDGVNVASVMEGESVTLHVNNTDGHRYFGDRQFWIEPEETGIVLVMWHHETPDVRYTQDERFRDRLQIDNQTGSLTIRNIRITDSGLYRMRSRFTGDLLFNITVYARLPSPIITRDSSSSSSSSSSGSCSLLCSVLNVSHVTFSWFKGHSLISSTSVSDLSSSVALHLEVGNQDKNNYSCEIKNPFSNQTTDLDINQLCQDFVQSCFSFTEAVIRFVVAAVVGVATVAIVLYDITSRRAEQKRRPSQSVPE